MNEDVNRGEKEVTTPLFQVSTMVTPLSQKDSILNTISIG